MRKKASESRGFTLMEMLIVVAIIAVLVAIAIPTFSGSLAKSKAAACAANCRSLYAVLSTKYMLEDLAEDEIAAVSLTKENDYTYDGTKYSCPSGGTIYAVFADGRISVRCSVHDDGQEGGSSISAVWNDGTTDKIWESVAKYPVGIDSTAVSGANRNKLLADLQEKGVDIDKIGATSWRYYSSGEGAYFEWTTADVSTLNKGDAITVMRYRLNGVYEGVYSVWEGTVGTKASGGENINVILSSTSKELTSGLSMDEKKDVQNVIQIYNDNSKGFSSIK